MIGRRKEENVPRQKEENVPRSCNGIFGIFIEDQFE